MRRCSTPLSAATRRIARLAVALLILPALAFAPIGGGSLATPPAASAAVCNQPSHAWVVTPGGSSYVHRSSILYLTGVVQPHTSIAFTFTRPDNTFLAAHTTALAGSNCVVAHEREAFAATNLPLGTVYVYASYTKWETYSRVTELVAILEIYA